MFQRTSFAAGVLLCFVIILADSATSRLVFSAERPNILWLIAEDMGPELGCYGTSQVKTPHLDQLAEQGVLYSNAFTVTPVCSTSRSAFMTGMYATSIGVHNHRSHRSDGFQLPSGVRVMTDWLRDGGYFTANVRKFPASVGFRGTGKTDWNFQYDGKPFDSDRWQDLKQHQPFYAQVNFPETHRGRAWNKAHQDLRAPADPNQVVIPPYYPDDSMTRRDWAQYLNCVMALDRKIGVILDLLEADGLTENTIVVFMGDHGRAHVRGKQWCYDSGLHVPLIIRWAKHFRLPQNFPVGREDSRLVASIDLTATTLDLAGVAIPAKMEGQVFLGERAGSEREYLFGTRDRCDETVFRIRTVRDKRYRYIRNFMPERPFLQLNRYKEASYPVIGVMRRWHEQGKLNPVQARLMAATRPAEELYDLARDPYEIHNLVDSAQHADVLKRMRQVLSQWIVTSGDQGQTSEPDEIVQRWEQKMKDNYRRAK